MDSTLAQIIAELTAASQLVNQQNRQLRERDAAIQGLEGRIAALEAQLALKRRR